MKPSCRTTRMHRFLLLTLLLSWQSASATTTSSTTSRSRSWEELQTWIVAMPALVEASTLQNTNDETALRPTTDASTNNTDRRKKHRVKNTNLFDPNQEEENTVSPDPRIINGVAAPENRYPHAVSLQYSQQHYCGASLVASDMILTAAHCGNIPASIVVGRYNLQEYDDDYEVFYGVKEIRHPDFDEETVNNDFLLILLDGVSSFPHIRLNQDEDVPSPGDSLVVMGWGDVDASDQVQTVSEYLRDTAVVYMSNEQCELSKGWVQTTSGPTMGYYEGGISNSMMCAVDDVGTVSDACQGDSGGALVYPGEADDGSQDVQVGIVSWGFGCADSNFPGVYSRVSSQYSWLRSTICTYSDSPPSYLGCEAGSSPSSALSSPATTPSATTQQDSEGLITIFVETDPLTPQDLGWDLSSVSTGETIDSRAIGFYANKYKEAFRHEVLVDPEQFYKLTIYDEVGDGFLGYVAVFKGTSYVMNDVLVLEPGFSSVSGKSLTHGFYVGNSPPRILTLELKFDNHPDELAWSLVNVDSGLELGFRWFGWYGDDSTSVTEAIPIFGNQGDSQQYIFQVLDKSGDGMCCDQGSGSYSLYLGDAADKNLVVSGGSFATEDSSTFEINAKEQVTLLSSSQLNASASNSFSSDTVTAADSYYMVPATGLCKENDQHKPSWITVTFSDYDMCCNESWNSQQCLNAKPSSSMSSSDVDTTNKNTIQYSPVTGSYTCTQVGLTCTVSCTGCGSIIRQTSGMALEYANKSTIVYTSEDESSSLILIETDRTSTNTISCDEGCTCSVVNENDLGCGLLSTPAVASSDQNGAYKSSSDEGATNDGILATSYLLTSLSILVIETLLIL